MRPAPTGVTLVTSVLLAVIGVVLIVETIVEGGSWLADGLPLGVLFLAVGVGRFYLARRSR